MVVNNYPSQEDVIIKILIASDQYVRINGVSTLVKNLQSVLSETFDVRVLALSHEKNSKYSNGVCYIKSFEVPFLGTGDRYTWIRRNALITALIRWKPDVVHIHTEFSIGDIALIIARYSHARILYTVHTNYDIYAKNLIPISKIRNHIYGTFIRKSYEQADLITVPTIYLKNKLLSHGLSKNVLVIPSGIQVAKFATPPDDNRLHMLRESYGLRDSDPCLITVSRLRPEKNIQELIDCMPKIHARTGAKLLIVGDGNLKNELERRVIKTHAEKYIIFTGEVDSSHISDYYHLARIFLTASTSEVQSLCNLEAMACGLPLVCRRDKVLRAVLTPGREGFLYDTPSECTAYVTALLSNSALYESMSHAAYHHAREFDYREYAHRIGDVYKSMVLH